MSCTPSKFFTKSNLIVRLGELIGVGGIKRGGGKVLEPFDCKNISINAIRSELP